MKVYLVGGAVRDQLLNYPVKERDWVVVGSTPEQLRAQGYQQVGRDFPVFLHPESKEEYALARTERKRGHGYYGFTCDFNPTVSLKDDLARRDLTINAMAMDGDERLIDPYGGFDDLQARILRHVSPAFAEDPVRVLRIARFAARYHHLGFRVANETRELMYRMVKRGELSHLVAERVWQEWQKSLEERNPEYFIKTLRACGALKCVFPELDALFGVPNPRQYHPEVDCGVHSLMVLRAAVALSKQTSVRFAALVHDLGKACTPIQEWPAHHAHETRGVNVIEQLCKRLRIPVDYRKFAVMVSQYHLNIHRFKELQASTIVKILEHVDAFRRPSWFHQLLVACEADAYGASDASIDYQPKHHWEACLEACKQIQAKPLIELGYQGEAIKAALHQRRVEAVKLYLGTV